MVNQYNRHSYNNPVTPGQRRRAPQTAQQAPRSNRQMPVGHGGGPSQQPQHYQQQTAPSGFNPASNIEQSQYTDHSQTYQGSYIEGIQGVQDAGIDPSIAAPNNMNATGMNFPDEIFQELPEDEETGHSEARKTKPRPEKTLSELCGL